MTIATAAHRPPRSIALGCREVSVMKADESGARDRAELAELVNRWQALTEREREIMLHVVRGRLNKQIAGDLGIVEKTVKVHRARVMEKMNIRSIAGLVHIAERLELAGHIHLPDGKRR